MEEQVEQEQEDFEREAEPDEEAEAEADTEAEPEGEQEQEPLAHIGPTEIAKAERAREAQRKKLAGILGDAYVAHECVLCTGLGFLPELPPLGTTLTLVAGEDGPAIMAEPPPTEIPLLEAPDKTRCPECDGWGEVLSGSRTSHGMVTPCGKCSGNGWIIVARTEPLLAPLPAPGVPPAPTNGPQSYGFGPDAWGRPEGHQHWGVPPSQIPG